MERVVEPVGRSGLAVAPRDGDHHTIASVAVGELDLTDDRRLLLCELSYEGRAVWDARALDHLFG